MQLYIEPIYFTFNRKMFTLQEVTMGGKYTDAQKRATMKYLEEKTDLIRFRAPKGSKAKYQALAKRRGKSLTAVIIELLERELQAETTENSSIKAVDNEQSKNNKV